MPPRFDHQYGPHSSQMSMRDYFAGQALAGLLGNPNSFTEMPEGVGKGERAAIASYKYADAMLAERDKQQEAK